MKNWITVFLCAFMLVTVTLGWHMIQLDLLSDYVNDQQTVVVKTVESMSIVEVIPKVLPGVVHIACPQWEGSGFIISEHLIITARHVADGVTEFEITLNDGTVIHATRAISSKDHDIAFIWVEEPMSTPVELGSIKECKLGQSVFAIGSPYGKINYNSVTFGIISGLSRDYYELNSLDGIDYGWDVAFQTDAPGHPGNSGGPIFTLDGKVRGILVGGFSPSLIIAMPMDIVLEELEVVKLKFTLNKYYHEEKPKDSYYNYEDDNEYYRK